MLKRLALYTLFVVLLADVMFGWGLGIVTGLSVKNVFLYLLLMVIGLEIAVSHKRLPFETWHVNLPFLLLIGWAAYSWMASILLDTGVDYKLVPAFIALKGSLIDHYLFFLVFFLGAPTRDDAIHLMRWLIMTLIVVNLVTVIDAYDIPNLGVIEQRDDGRVKGPLGEPNQYGTFTVMFLPPLLALFYAAKGVSRAVYGAGVFLGLWVLILTVSRGSILGLLGGALIAGMLCRRYLDIRLLAKAAVVTVVLSVVVFSLLGEELRETLAARTVDLEATGADAYEMTSGRTWIWMISLTLQMEQPLSFLFGFGWNTYLSLNPLNSHNTYLTYLFELGLPGLFLFLLLLWSVVSIILKALRQGSDRALMIGCLVGFLGVSICIFSVNLSQAWYFIWGFIGLIVRIAISNYSYSERPG